MDPNNWESLERTKALQLFQNGKFAMFIHWGLYSVLGSNYHNRTYYGISEWIMRPEMANISIEEYMNYASMFHPDHFNATEIVQMAKDAGMKYIVMTAKHHDGFAMYHSAVGNFGIFQSTTWEVDPIREVSTAAKKEGLGFGVYYSHNYDWTFPGGTGGPSVDPETGRPSTFEDYFERKCLPQIKELTTLYGELDIIWLDTPGSMPRVHVEQLIDEVRKNQPGALISGRVGYGLGDYTTLGDMEIPDTVNMTVPWESVDTTNDSWGFASYDQNWKTPMQILQRLLSCVARGGTYMLNIGPRGDGAIPKPAVFTLQIAGRWIQHNAYAVYGTQPSPWEHSFPWGDITRKGNSLFLLVFKWPVGGKLYLPGLKNEIVSVFAKGVHRCNFEDEGNLYFERNDHGVVLQLPTTPLDSLFSVIEVLLQAAPVYVDSTWAIDPSMTTDISSVFARTEGGAEKIKHKWMEKFGEWKSAVYIHFVNAESKAVWEVIILKPGYYAVDLTYSGLGRLQWEIASTGAESIQNEQNSSQNYQLYHIGWILFLREGKFSITVRCISNEQRVEKAKLKSIHFSPISVV